MDPDLEARIRALCEADRLEDAATAAMLGYGPQVYAFLVARMRSRDHADDVFAQLGEDLWRGVGGFRWQSSFRTWMYTLARHAAHRYERTPQHQARRHTTASRAHAIVERVRTETQPFIKTEVKDRMAELRATLSLEEQTLLILRVSREMPWKDIARVMSDVPLKGSELDRASAAARQRFTSLKRKLRALAEREGLLAPKSEDAGEG